MEEAYITINNVLVNLINEIWELEEKAIITEEFGDLTNNDMRWQEYVLHCQETEYNGRFAHNGDEQSGE